MMEEKPETEQMLWYGNGDAEELNVVEFPLALLARSIPKDQKVVEFSDWIRDEATGKRLNRTFTISANARTELPNWWDQDVFVAGQVHTGRANGWSSPVVEWTAYELLKLMGLPNDGKNWRRMIASFQNWQGLRVEYSHFRRKGRWVKLGAFSFIQDFELTRKKATRPDDPQVFTWSRYIFESVQEGNTKRLDSDFYFSLKLPTTRRLYRFLDKRLYGRPTYSRPLVSFCTEKLGMTRGYKKPVKYRERLLPAYEELIGRGFLGDVKERFPRGNDGELEVSFRKGRGVRRERKSSQVVVPEATCLTGVAKELAERGMTASRAEELAQDESLGEQIKLVVEWFDWLVAKKKQLKNVGGWLNNAITKRWMPPSSFETKAQREDKEKKRVEWKRQIEEAQRAEKEREAKKRETERQLVKDYLNSLSTDKEREEVREQAFAAGNPFARKFLRQSERTAKTEGKAQGFLADEFREQMVRDYVLGLLGERKGASG